MVTTVTLNPCIDLTLYLDGLCAGGLNLVGKSRSDVCGKGVNVSVVLRALELSTMCCGISFDVNGGMLDAFLLERCIAHDFAVSRGNIRTNIKLMDTAKNEMTEINSLGDIVDASVVEEYIAKLKKYAAASSIITFSGRVPNGGENSFADIYQRSLVAIKGLDVFTVVDAEKEPLRLAVLAKPDLIKPNLFELESAFGCKTHSKGDILDACRGIIKKGVKIVCCTMGGDGAMIADKETAWFSPPMDVEIKGFQGAGDSMVAGICKAARERLGLEEMLRCGTAAASASLLREGTQMCLKKDFDRLLPLVKIEPV